jgi:hypothetical protein
MTFNVPDTEVPCDIVAVIAPIIDAPTVPDTDWFPDGLNAPCTEPVIIQGLVPCSVAIEPRTAVPAGNCPTILAPTAPETL